MICDKVKECFEMTRHMPLPVERGKQKGKKKQNQSWEQEDAYQQPLGQSPCRSDAQQKKCIDFLDSRSQIKCEENGKVYILNQSKINPRYEVIKFFVDQGIITNPEAGRVYKCDNVLLIKDSGTAILVELKGKEIRHALKQLSATLDQKELQTLWDCQKRIFGRVVCRSTPPRIQNTNEYMGIKEDFARRNGNLKIAEENMVEEYDALGYMGKA